MRSSFVSSNGGLTGFSPSSALLQTVRELLENALDARASRLGAALDGARVFEVDHPATQAHKLAVLADAPSRATYLAWDFERDPMTALPARLAAVPQHLDQSEPDLLIDGVRIRLLHGLEVLAEVGTPVQQRRVVHAADAERRALAIVEEAKARATDEGSKIVAAAKSEAEQQTVKAREALREQVAALAVKGAEQILRREVNASVHADLLGRLKTEL